MADISFECPECKQHLTIDAGSAGIEIQCPTCSRPITVPQSSPTVPVGQIATPEVKVKPHTGKWIGARISAIVLIIVCLGYWFYGVHRPYGLKVKQEQEDTRLREVQRKQLEEQERQASQLREKQQEEKEKAEMEAKAALAIQRTDQIHKLRDSDEEAMNNYIRMAGMQYYETVTGTAPAHGYVGSSRVPTWSQQTRAELISLAQRPLNPTTPERIPEPVVGDHDNVAELMQYVCNKLNIDKLQNPSIQIAAEAGCIGKSDLWIYRSRFGLTVPLLKAQVFLLRYLDPTSGTIITETDPRLGRQTVYVNFKCANNKKRCVGIQRSVPFFAELKDKISFLCVDEQDAQRVGKALALLICAYGGKGELMDSSDSFSSGDSK